MGTGFLFAVFQAITMILLDTTENTLLMFQINDVLYPSFILMFLIHGVRIKWNRTPNIIKLIASTWYGLLIVAVFFYKLVELPSEGQVLFLNLKNTSVRTEGQMLVINDIYIIGRGFEFFAHAFRLFSVIIILYSYWQSRDIARENNVGKSQNIFILAILSAAVFPIGMMGEMLFIWNDAQYFFDLHVFDLITFLGVSIVAFKYPETLLISKTQILRVYKINQQLFPPDYQTMSDAEMLEKIQDYMIFIKQAYPELIPDKI